MTGPAKILVRIANNDRSAIAECVNAYSSLVYRMAKSFTKSIEEAETESNEIFLDIWRCAHKFESSGLDEVCFIYAVARCRLRRLIEPKGAFSKSNLSSPSTTLIAAHPTAI